MRLFTFTHFRIVILFGLLVFVALYTIHQSTFTRAWNKTIEVVVYPINGDDSYATANYIRSLQLKHFQPIDQWMTREAKRYNLLLKDPTHITLGEQIREIPPSLSATQNPVKTLWWGLKMSWWAYKNTPDDKSNLERIRMFIVYQQGKKDKPLEHSLGLQKGLIGIVHAYATHSQSKQNNIVITHEMLHTVGAQDKYDELGNPLNPNGFAQPNRNPLYPQRYAEIMAGQVPESIYRSRMAESLKSVLINPYTASEINWLK